MPIPRRGFLIASFSSPSKELKDVSGDRGTSAPFLDLSHYSVKCQRNECGLHEPLGRILYPMNLVPKVKFDNALRDTISLPIDEYFVHSNFVMG